MWTIIILFLLPVLNGQTTAPPSCINNNADRLTADQVITIVVDSIDNDKDGILSMGELFTDLYNKFDVNGDSIITEAEFVQRWHEFFRDVPEFAEYLFKHFDADCSGEITTSDVPQLVARFDINQNSVITDSEFAVYLSNLYYNCVPHYQQGTCIIT